MVSYIWVSYNRLSRLSGLWGIRFIRYQVNQWSVLLSKVEYWFLKLPMVFAFLIFAGILFQLFITLWLKKLLRTSELHALALFRLSGSWVSLVDLWSGKSPTNWNQVSLFTCEKPRIILNVSVMSSLSRLVARLSSSSSFSLSS